MSYDSLCDELMLLTNQIVAAIVEHRDGYRLCERIRTEIIRIDEDKKLFALMRGAQLVETAKEYRNEVGNLHVIMHKFDRLVSLMFPLRDNNTLMVVTEPDIVAITPLITDIKQLIIKHNSQI